MASFNAVAEGGTKLASLAAQLQVMVPEVLGEEGKKLLDDPISPATHQLLTLVKAKAADYPPPARQAKLHEIMCAVVSVRGTMAVDEGEAPSMPYEEDILTLDMNDFTIPHNVTNFLFVNNLGPVQFGAETTADATFPLAGCLWGMNKRPFFTFMVAYAGKRRQLPMFVDTGGQETFLNLSSWRALAPNIDFSNWAPDTSRRMEVHGVVMEVKLGHNRTAGVNMVGSIWLERAKAALLIDYCRNGCLLISDGPSLHPMLPDITV